MTDEEFGRAWAKQQGYEPARRGEFFAWLPSTDPNLPGEIPTAVRFSGRMWHCTEAAAYADLGAAVRAVHAAVPPLADPDYSVRKHTPEGQLAGLLACCRAAVESPGNPVVLAELRLWLARFEKGEA